MEKHDTGNLPPPGTRRGRRPAHARLLLVGAVVLLAVFYFPRFLPKVARHCGDGRLRYDGEHISWEACGDLNGQQLECSEIDVPMDHFDAENSGNKTFSIPLVRLRGKNATQNVLLNPGGPGGSGFSLMYRYGENLHTIVGEGFHLLTFDPRGMNNSRPLSTCYPDAETRRRLSPVRTYEVVADSPETWAWTQNRVRACEDTLGEHGRYLNTPQTAADMNSILDAVGQRDLVYWGFSYGTTLGQTYADMFPERARRVIIDGVSNNHHWYNSRFEEEAMVDSEKVWAGFFRECCKAGPEACPLAAHGDGPEALQDTVMAYLEGLRAQPLPVYVNNTVYGTLTYGSMVYFDGIYAALYKPALWHTLADNLAQLLAGNATAAFLAYGRGGALAGHDGNVVTFNDGVTGPGAWPAEREALLELLAPFVNGSLFGPAMVRDWYAKALWRLPTTHNYRPRATVHTAHPLLILSTTYDPICPLVSAEAARATFAGARLVEVRGYGHCSLAAPSACVARRVRAFFENGTMPEADHVFCDVDGPYFAKPSPEAPGLLAKEDDDDDDEARVRRAQRALARDWDWSR